jgi:tetratricopeptide (TPR) repeat protein
MKSFIPARRLSGLMLLLLVMQPLRAQNMKCFVLRPPDRLLDSVKTVAVADFSISTRYISSDKGGNKTIDKILSAIDKAQDVKRQNDYFLDSGKKLADHIIAGMLDDKRGVHDVGTGFLGLGKKEGRTFIPGARTNVFVVIERDRMDQIMEELKLSQTGLIDENQAVQVGKMLGADAIITGSVNVAVNDNWVKEKRTSKEKTTEVWCQQRTAKVTATIRITRVETAQLLGSSDASNSQSIKKCEGDYGGAMPPAESTIDVCLKAVANDLVNYFVPRFEQQKFDFAKIEGDDFKRFVEPAKDALEAYDINTAYLQMKAILERDPYNHAALYDLGVLYEIVGSYEKATKQYEMARKLMSQEEKYTKGFSRASKSMQFEHILRNLGVIAEEYNFNVTAEQLTSASSKKIQIHGKNTDRWDVKSQPDVNSETILRVPGEIELDCIDSGGDWYKVRLLDGREGYFLKKNARFIK